MKMIIFKYALLSWDLIYMYLYWLNILYQWTDYIILIFHFEDPCSYETKGNLCLSHLCNSQFNIIIWFLSGVQRELRVGNVNRPMRLQNIPVPVTRMYKSVKWWPEDPGEGKIFFKAHQEELNTNFRDQLQQVWNVGWSSCRIDRIGPDKETFWA